MFEDNYNNDSNDMENSNSNTTNSNKPDLTEGSDQRYSRSYYKSPYEEQNTSMNSSSGGNSGNNKKKKNKGGFAKKLVAVATLAVVGGSLAGASFEGVRYISAQFYPSKVASVQLPDESQNQNSSPSNEAKSVVGNDKTVDSTETTQLATTVTDVSNVVESVMPSVVSITSVVTTQVQVPDFFGGFGDGTQGGNTYEQQEEASGSGIIIDENNSELLIVTNNHVVAGAKTLSVGFADGNDAEAKIKGTDADNDLAVIAVDLKDIDSKTLSAIKIAEFGDSDQLKVGEAAIAIGNALGYGQSVTTGVISAVNREVTVDNVTNSLIQTDAAINPGNSGGALLNMQGKVIGINSVKYSSTEVEGMGYALPISKAIPIINELVTKETRDRVDVADTGYLGIAGVDVSEEAANTYNMPTGVYVAQVVEGSAAETAGIKKGDIITKFDGNGVSSMESLQNTLQYYAAGSTVIVTVKSAQEGEYQEKDITVTLGRKVQ